MPTLLCVRLPFIVGIGIIAGGFGATPSLVTGHWLDAAFYGCAAAVVLGVAVRFRSLSVSTDGLTRVHRFRYVWHAPWVDVRVIQSSKDGFATFDQLLVHRPRASAAAGTNPRTTTRRRRLFKGDRRVFIGMYDKRWRTGLVGAALSATGSSTEAPVHVG
jgi:hypothetical protein